MSDLHLNIDLSFQQLVDIVKQLNPAEKLKLNDIIWNEGAEIPIEHQQLVSERKLKSKNNPNRMLNWDEVSKDL